MVNGLEDFYFYFLIDKLHRHLVLHEPTTLPSIPLLWEEDVHIEHSSFTCQ